MKDLIYCLTVLTFFDNNLQFDDFPKPNQFTKKLNIESVGCFGVNESNWCAPTEDNFDDVPGIYNLYWLSYMYLGTAGFIVAFLVGSVISLFTGKKFRFKVFKQVCLESNRF